jgi:TRAP transporter TAXI family solute receptor
MGRNVPTVGWLISYHKIRHATLACRRLARRPLLRRLLVSRRWLLVLFLVVIPVVYAGTVLSQRTHTTYTLLTGPKGGTYDLLGPRLAETLNRPDKIERFLHLNIVPDFTVKETCGSLENLYDIDEGLGQLGFAEDGLPLYFQRANRCALSVVPELSEAQERHAEIRMRALMPLYKSPLQVLARKSFGINEVGEIPSHAKTYMGPEGSATAFVARLVLDHYGIVVDRVGENLNHEQAVQRIRDGKIDVVIVLAGLKSWAIRALLRDREFHLLQLERAKGVTVMYPFLVEVKIPGSALYETSKEITTVGTNTILAVSSDLSEIEVYEIITKIDRSMPDILQDVPLNYAKLADMDPLKSLYYPLHEGAVRFYANNPPFFLNPRVLAGIGTYLSLLFAFYTLSSQFIRDYLVHRCLRAVDRAEEAFRKKSDQPPPKRYYHYINKLKRLALRLLKDERITLDDFKRVDEYVKGHS